MTTTGITFIRQRGNRAGIISARRTTLSATNVNTSSLLLGRELLSLDVRGQGGFTNNRAILEGGAVRIRSAGPIRNRGVDIDRVSVAAPEGEDYDSYDETEDVITGGLRNRSIIRSTDDESISLISTQGTFNEEGDWIESKEQRVGDDIIFGAGSVLDIAGSIHLASADKVLFEAKGLERSKTWSQSGEIGRGCSWDGACKTTHWKRSGAEFEREFIKSSVNVGNNLSISSLGDIDNYGTDLNVGGTYEAEFGGDYKDHALKRVFKTSESYEEKTTTSGGILNALADLVNFIPNLIQAAHQAVGNAIGGEAGDFIAGAGNTFVGIGNIFKAGESESSSSSAFESIRNDVVSVNAGEHIILRGTDGKKKTGEINLEGSQYNAGDSISLSASEVSITSVVDTMTRVSHSHSKFTGGMGYNPLYLRSEREETNMLLEASGTHQKASLNAGKGQIVIDAEKDIALTGVDKTAGTNITIRSEKGSISDLAVTDYIDRRAS